MDSRLRGNDRVRAITSDVIPAQAGIHADTDEMVQIFRELVSAQIFRGAN
jgi:hypothetical protein